MPGKRVSAGSAPREVHDLSGLAGTLKVIGSEPRLRLIQFLSQPRYLEEIASFLGMARQSAQHHVDRLLQIGVIEKRPGQRATGPVTDYVVAPHRFFTLGDDLFRLGALHPAGADDGSDHTQPLTSAGTGPSRAEGPALVEVHGMSMGRIHRLAGTGPWLIGRHEDRDVPLSADIFASGKHAKIVTEGGGGHALIDMYSTNGTAINWTPLPEGSKRPLSHGDVVLVGKTLFVYWA